MKNTGFLRVVTPEELDARDAAEVERVNSEAAAAAAEAEGADSELLRHIRAQWELMKDHRATTGLDRRLLDALRTYKGEYDDETLADIRRFGGSEVYGRITATKCRAATGLLRDIYFGLDEPWELEPTPDPAVPGNVADKVQALVGAESQALAAAGQPVDEAELARRAQELMTLAQEAAVRQAYKMAQRNRSALDDYLVEGGFYEALRELLVDLPIFPYAAIKGPVVRMVEDVRWQGGQAMIDRRPRLEWERVSPFDIYMTPGVHSAAQADFIHRQRITHAELSALLDVPGYDQDAVRGALAAYYTGLHDWMDPIDSSRADAEGRENPTWNRSGMIDIVEYHGSVPGRVLMDYGFGEAEQVTEPERAYSVQAWVVGRYVLKVQINPSPRRRPPFFITSYDKTPGTLIGTSLPDQLEDIQQIGNGALRALSNNMALASGPQVVVLANRFAETENTSTLYPWKQWEMVDAPNQGALPPVSFYQPNSNAQELLGVYDAMMRLADEVSAIPRYMTGSGATGGAGRTASGLNMLLGNASKMLQDVASNVDLDILEPTIQELYSLLLLTGREGFQGDENIVVKGAALVQQRQAERARQLEFLQLTANPIDMQITGIEGRAEVLRGVADGIGLRGSDVVPSRDQLALRAQQMQMQAAQAGAGPGNQSPGGPRGAAPPDQKPANSTSPQENSVTPRLQGVG